MRASAGQRMRRAVWLAALVPLLPIALALVVIPLPSEGVEELAGSWRVIAFDAPLEPGDARLGDDAAWSTMTVPGRFFDGRRTPVAWIERGIAAPPELAGRDLMLVVPNVRSASGRVFVNDRLIGHKGVPGRPMSLDVERMDAYLVPRELFGAAGGDTLRVELLFPWPGGDGLPDARFLLGDPTIVSRYVERNAAVKHFLEYGAMLVDIFGAALIGYLLVRRKDAPARAMYRAAFAVMIAVALYAAGKTGIFLSFFVDSAGVGAYVTYAIIGIAATTPELVESYYVERRTWFRLANRVVCAVAFGLSLLIDIARVYPTFSLWLFLVIAHACVFAARDLLGRGGRGAVVLDDDGGTRTSLRAPARTAFGPVFASAIGVTAVTGAADLLSDLNVLYLPRLFSYGVANLGVIAIVLVLGDFLRLARRTERLSTSLQEKNQALTVALVQAQESARAKSEFLANTSHELRTPLNAILNIPHGLLEQIVERAVVRCTSCGALFEPPDDDDGGLGADDACDGCGARGKLVLEHKRFASDDGDALAAALQSIIGSGEHLLHVVNDILDFSKLDAGRMRLDIQDEPLAPLLERARQTAEPLARAADITLVFAPVDGAVRVRADSTRVVQVLLNLLANAIKFSSAGSRVDVRTELGPRSVAIAVQDRGIGIAPEHHALIFESFRQVEGGHTRKHGGTGLGLAIVKKIVELHGGKVSLVSALGQGSTFVVELPRAGG